MDVQARLERLERDNQRLKWAATSLTGLIVVAFMAGGAQSDRRLADIVQAKKFQLLNPAGNVVSEWTVTTDDDNVQHPQISFTGRSGSSLINDGSMTVELGPNQSFLTSSNIRTGAKDFSWYSALFESGFAQSKGTPYTSLGINGNEALLYLKDSGNHVRRITATSGKELVEVPGGEPPRPSFDRRYDQSRQK